MTEVSRSNEEPIGKTDSLLPQVKGRDLLDGVDGSEGQGAAKGVASWEGRGEGGRREGRREGGEGGK